MACPYFVPAERMTSWRRPPILPLGDPYEGTCQVEPSVPAQPDKTELREYCNMGYARHRCPRFPRVDGPDAVRFSIARHEAGEIEVCCVLERNHGPFGLNRLAWSEAEGRFRTPHPDAALQALAQAYVASYLRRKKTW